MKQAGFTLLEVLLVVVILGILAALTVPKYAEHLQKVKLKTALLESEAALRLAKHNAQALNQPVAASFNIQNNSLVGFDVVVLDASETLIDSIDIHESVSITVNVNVGQVIFNPTQSISIKNTSGAILPKQNCTLQYSDENDVTGSIVIFERSGAIQLFKN